MQTLLVLGVDRVVGANVIATLSDRLQVAGVGQHLVKIQGCPTRRADLREPAAVARLVKKYAPNWVVYAGGLAGSSWDAAPAEVGPEPEIASALLDAAEEVDARLTYISTDAVFSGPRMFHREDSPLADPLLSAAPALASAAIAVEEVLRGSGALLVRTHAYGWSPRLEAPEFAEAICMAMEDNLDLTVNPWHYATPILASDLAEWLYAAWRQDLQGVWHMAGAERTSSARFAAHLAAELGLSPRRSEAFGLGVCRHGAESSLTSLRARQALNMPLPMLSEGIERFVAQAENGYRDRFQTLPELDHAAA